MRDYVVSRKVEKQCTDKSGEKKDRVYYKAPKIQRLITEKRLRRKSVAKRTKLDAYKASKEQKQKYEKLMSQYVKERKASQAAERKAADEAKAAQEKKWLAPAFYGVVPYEAEICEVWIGSDEVESRITLINSQVATRVIVCLTWP